MKFKFFIALGAIVFFGYFFHPAVSHALLTPQKINGIDGYYDPEGKKFWYYSPTNFFKKTYLEQQTAIDKMKLLTNPAVTDPIVDPTKPAYPGLVGFHMASTAEFDQGVSAAFGLDKFMADFSITILGTTGYDVRFSDSVDNSNQYGYWVFDDTVNGGVGFVGGQVLDNTVGVDVYNVSIGTFAVSDVVPEPSTYILLTIALSVVATLRYRQKKAKQRI